jgi:hypothetical protein
MHRYRKSAIAFQVDANAAGQFPVRGETAHGGHQTFLTLGAVAKSVHVSTQFVGSGVAQFV